MVQSQATLLLKWTMLFTKTPRHQVQSPANPSKTKVPLPLLVRLGDIKNYLKTHYGLYKLFQNVPALTRRIYSLLHLVSDKSKHTITEQYQCHALRWTCWYGLWEQGGVMIHWDFPCDSAMKTTWVSGWTPWNSAHLCTWTCPTTLCRKLVWLLDCLWWLYFCFLVIWKHDSNKFLPCL